MKLNAVWILDVLADTHGETQKLWANTAACGAKFCAYPRLRAILRNAHLSGGGWVGGWKFVYLELGSRGRCSWANPLVLVVGICLGEGPAGAGRGPCPSGAGRLCGRTGIPPPSGPGSRSAAPRGYAPGRGPAPEGGGGMPSDRAVRAVCPTLAAR